MGKNLKGKEIGNGICQKKGGKYSARYTAVVQGSRNQAIQYARTKTHLRYTRH